MTWKKDKEVKEEEWMRVKDEEWKAKQIHVHIIGAKCTSTSSFYLRKSNV